MGLRPPAGERPWLSRQVGRRHRAKAIADDGAVQGEDGLVGLALVPHEVGGGVQAEAGKAGALGVDAHGDQLRHHARGHEGGRGLADELGDVALEAFDEGALAVAVVGEPAGLEPVGDQAEFRGRGGLAEVLQVGPAALAELAALVAGQGHQRNTSKASWRAGPYLKMAKSSSKLATRLRPRRRITAKLVRSTIEND
jgi:hypothetical protein